MNTLTAHGTRDILALSFLAAMTVSALAVFIHGATLDLRDALAERRLELLNDRRPA